mmetsp:Transcript_5550/g.6448  ORF Transcript_5550/g.6448 Transcript_5550/m.6448 type:complete len:301 (-) Transcript_5550:116-1018(-)|eukprot:CAMPEP_0194173738 /NCGR_PEP_ID=MMETSP0154-20130528/8016_1 /TAXON_ID=1049557 /ORGANISM="Thalassiothrix antarctica, Strain L6-D1" /LENGTH=300 /DNA_ID=CAMNT_0038886903 /DNA_START=103 /DNA_END=1005 /DNA_ORIENTATION=-
MLTWEARLNAVFGAQGYENCMRRSLQTIILYEANRCISGALSSLRPFQRKLAYVDMANALLNSVEGLLSHQRAEVLWRTGTSKEPMNAETAWKRRKLLNKELENIRAAVSPLLPNRTHDQAIDAYIQVQFETVTGNTGTVPSNWQHAHNNAIMCYRLYYRGDQLDTNFPAPRPPKEIYVATEKPITVLSTLLAPATGSIHLVNGSIPNSMIAHRSLDEQGDGKNRLEPGDNIIDRDEVNSESRRLLLQEVRQHLDLLKEFEGVIPEDDLSRRKRELFMAMPPAPPSHSKRQKFMLLEEDV